MGIACAMAILYGSQHGRVYACQAPPVLSDAYSECQNMTMPAFTLPPMDCLPAPVLIVEDESLMREKLLRLLLQLGYAQDALVFVTNLAEARHWLAHNPAALALVEDIRAHYGGNQIYIPRGDKFNRAKLHAAIRREFNGRNYAELARRHGLTEMRVRQIVVQQQARDVQQRQGRLPGLDDQ